MKKKPVKKKKRTKLRRVLDLGKDIKKLRKGKKKKK